MSEQRWYYELTNTKTGEAYLTSANAPIKAEKLCEILCLDGYTAKEISKEEYDAEEQHGS